MHDTGDAGNDIDELEQVAFWRMNSARPRCPLVVVVDRREHEPVQRLKADGCTAGTMVTKVRSTRDVAFTPAWVFDVAQASDS